MVFVAGFSSAQQIASDTLSQEQSLYNKARKLADSAKYSAAVKDLKKAVKIRPNFWEAYNMLAECKIRMKDFGAADKDLDKANSIAPMNYETMKWKGVIYFMTNKFNDAKKALDTAVYFATEEKIDDAELLYYRAKLMYKGKNYKGALETCKAILEFKADDLEVYLLMAEIRFVRKEYNYIIKELTEAVQLTEQGKNDNRVYKLLAKSRFENQDYKGALADWNRYLQDFPKEEEALISRAVAKINLNDNSGAISDLDDAIKVNPANPVSYCYRGVAKGGNKQYVEALKDLDYSIKLKFNYPAAYVNRAAIKFASKDKRGACADLEKADGLGDEMAFKLIERYCRTDGR
jgi:tetratricopeptide (TPR) repeat protein